MIDTCYPVAEHRHKYDKYDAVDAYELVERKDDAPPMPGKFYISREQDGGEVEELKCAVVDQGGKVILFSLDLDEDVSLTKSQRQELGALLKEPDLDLLKLKKFLPAMHKAAVVEHPSLQENANTLLIQAILEDKYGFASLLVQQGADLDARGKKQKTAVEWAKIKLAMDPENEKLQELIQTMDAVKEASKKVEISPVASVHPKESPVVRREEARLDEKQINPDPLPEVPAPSSVQRESLKQQSSTTRIAERVITPPPVPSLESTVEKVNNLHKIWEKQIAIEFEVISKNPPATERAVEAQKSLDKIKSLICIQENIISGAQDKSAQTAMKKLLDLKNLIDTGKPQGMLSRLYSFFVRERTVANDSQMEKKPSASKKRSF